MIDRARTEYARVLRLLPNSFERHHNQAYMCFLRDFIAEHEGRDAEAVQTEYERPAWEDIDRRMNQLNRMQDRNQSTDGLNRYRSL